MTKGMIAIIGGTGLGDSLVSELSDAKPHKVETPFGRPSDDIIVGRIGQKPIAFLNRHGRGHKYPPGKIPYAANIFALKSLGVKTIIASGAVGSLRDGIKPGDLVVVDQFIDKTFKRKNTFFEDYGAVHCEMSQPVCNRLAAKILHCGKDLRIKIHPKGTYICMEGPQFSTQAESLMHKAWGGDLIGMTAMPEAKLAREAQICYSMITLVSDYDCWKSHKKDSDAQTLLKEILTNLKTATNNCLELIKKVLQSDSDLLYDDCSCRKSLALAVWTNQNIIEATIKKRLSLLFE